MKVVLKILIALGSIWILLMTLFALLAIASGHNIPTSTYVYVASNIGIAVLVIIGCIIGLKKL